MNEIISEIAGLRMELKEIIESFQKKKRDMLVLYNDKLPMEERAREIELTIAYEVSVESDESGKKVYSNDILRNAEARKRLQSDIEYELLKDQLDFLEKKRSQDRDRYSRQEIPHYRAEVTLVMVEEHIITHYKEVIDYERSN